MAIIVVVLLVGWALYGAYRPSSGTTMSTVLVSNGTLDILPPQQFDAVDFKVNETATIEGKITTSFGVTIYRMSPSEFQSFVRTLVVSGYQWTSGFLPLDTAYNFDVPVPSGAWVLVMNNPDPLNTTAVGFNTDLTLVT